MSGASMEQGQCVPDLRIADAGQPPGLFRREQRNVASQRFDEQDFGQLGEHGLASGLGHIGIVY